MCTFWEFLCMISFFLSPERRCKYVWVFFTIFSDFSVLWRKITYSSAENHSNLCWKVLSLKQKMIRKTGVYTREVFNSNCLTSRRIGKTESVSLTLTHCLFDSFLTFNNKKPVQSRYSFHLSLGKQHRGSRYWKVKLRNERNMIHQLSVCLFFKNRLSRLCSTFFFFFLKESNLQKLSVMYCTAAVFSPIWKMHLEHSKYVALISPTKFPW